MDAKPTERSMLDLLAARYSGDEWAFLRHVPDRTGGATRTADAIAMNLWESRGLVLHGFEVKVSRRDWLAELKNPGKADVIARHCDYWWLVVPNPDIVKEGELPHGWGLLAGDKQLRIVVPASLIEDENGTATKFRALPRRFVAASLRRACEQVLPDAVLAAERRKAYNEGQAAGYDSGKAEAEHQYRLMRDKLAALQDFERDVAPLIRLRAHSDAVKAVLAGMNRQSYEARLRLLADQARRFATDIDTTLAEPVEGDLLPSG
jgi:hypothetical protein